MDPSRSRFSTVPVEIRQAILSEMPNFDTLHTVLEADESLRSAFWGHESAILDKVLRKMINPRLIPEVLAVLESTRFHFGEVKLRVPDDPWSKERVVELIERYCQRQPASVKWKLSDAISINEIYDHIRFFVGDFASSALSVHLVRGNKEHSPVPLSQNERCRIEAVFFRFELFCNLFRQRACEQERFDSTELWEIFLNKFSPWENEQLACINDYLTAKILIPFDDVADHDVWWGDERIYAHEEISPSAENYTQGTISNGLAYLHRLVTVATYEQRYEMLGAIPSTSFDFLSDGLMEHQPDVPDQPLSAFSETEKKALASKSSVEDPDPGPYNAWDWAHWRDYGEEFVFSDLHQSLRKRGYVMWDDWRLWKSNLFSKPFDEDDYPISDDELTEQRQEEIEESWARRSEIYVRGGRGWWSKDDESRIVWPKDPAPNKGTGVPEWK